jgi:hypothetical protein
MAINSVNGNTLLESGIFAPCRAATTAPITLSGLQTVDGVALNAGDRVLVTHQADATTNGLYAASSGDWVRTSDARSNPEFFDGMAVIVARGTQAGLIFLCTCTDDPIVIGTSLLTFASQPSVQIQSQTATSSTAITVGIGSRTFATQSGKSFSVNQWVLVYDAVAVMLGQITAYAAGSLTVNVVAITGSGSHADWTIVLNNSPAATGLSPPVGTGNVTGPGSSVAGHIAAFADTTGKVLSDSGIPLGTLAGRNTLLFGDAGVASIGDAALVSGAAPLPYCAAQPNDNLHLANDVVNATRDINVMPGRCRDDADLINLQLKGTMVKRLDQAYAAGGVTGSPAGACDSGTKGASQTWHIFLIAALGVAITSVSRTSNIATVTAAGHPFGIGGTVRTYGIGGSFDGLAVITAVTTNTFSYANTGSNVGATTVTALADGFDILASQSYTAPTMPSGWSAKQCLGSILTDPAGNVCAFNQYGDEFWLAAPTLDFSNLLVTTSSSSAAVKTPNGVRVKAILNMLASASSGSGVYVRSPDAADVAPGGSTGQIFTIGVTIGTNVWEQVKAWTDVTSKLRLSSDANIRIYANTMGWQDPRRRLF